MGSFVGVSFFLAGGGRFQYTKFGTALFEVGGGRFFIIHYSHVCAMFHIQGSQANCKSNKSLTHKLRYLPLFLRQQEGAFWSLQPCVCPMFHIQGSMADCNQTRV